MNAMAPLWLCGLETKMSTVFEEGRIFLLTKYFYIKNINIKYLVNIYGIFDGAS